MQVDQLKVIESMALIQRVFSRAERVLIQRVFSRAERVLTTESPTQEKRSLNTWGLVQG